MFEQQLRAELKKRAKAYGFTVLAEKTGLSRQALYDFFAGGDVCLSNLLKLTEVLGLTMVYSDLVEEKDVLANLHRYGAPLMSGKEPHSPLSLEETVERSLFLLSKESRLTSVLPYLLVKKAPTLKLTKLLNDLKQPEQLQLMGYLVDVALAYRKRKELVKLKKQLEKRAKNKKPLMLRARDQHKQLKDFERFDNPVAKYWQVGTRDDLASLVDRCRKWEELERAS